MSSGRRRRGRTRAPVGHGASERELRRLRCGRTATRLGGVCTGETASARGAPHGRATLDFQGAEIDLLEDELNLSHGRAPHRGSRWPQARFAPLLFRSRPWGGAASPGRGRGARAVGLRARPGSKDGAAMEEGRWRRLPCVRGWKKWSQQ
jgi:hypothetical protein